MATEFYPTSGTKVVQNIVRELQKLGVETVVFTSQHDILKNKRRGRVLHGEEQVYLTPSIFIRQIPYAVCPLAPYDLFKVVADENVDVLHAHVFPMYMISNLSALVKMATRVRLVLTFHGLHFQGYINPLYRNVMHAYYGSYFKFLCSQADSITVLGKGSAENAQRFGADQSKIAIVPNAIDVSSFNPSPPQNEREKFTVINVGRIEHSKGVFSLLQAARILHKKYQNRVQFLFIGDGPHRKRLEEAIRTDKKLNSNVKLLGYVQNVGDFLRESDVFVLPSYYEGMPISLLEAMACAKPVVATNVGDVPDVIENEFNGLLVEPGSPIALADAIDKLLSDPEYSRKLAINGYETVKALFDIKVVCKRLKSIYEKLCESSTD